MIFEITQDLTITMNGFHTNLKTRFEVEVLVLDKAEKARVFGIMKNKIATFPISDNNYLKVIEELEWQTYPIEIETDIEGNFQKMLNHKKWLKNWENKTLPLIEQSDGAENVKDIRNKYHEIAKSEHEFIESKFKEPYWNLLFFNPPIDVANKPSFGTTLNWNIKSLGIVPCTGRTTLQNTASNEVIIHFESRQKLPQNIIDSMQAKIALTDIDWDQQKANLHISSTFDTFQKKIVNKKALFEFIVEGSFSYVEITSIDLK